MYAIVPLNHFCLLINICLVRFSSFLNTLLENVSLHLTLFLSLSLFLKAKDHFSIFPKNRESQQSHNIENKIV